MIITLETFFYVFHEFCLNRADDRILLGNGKRKKHSSRELNQLGKENKLSQLVPQSLMILLLLQYQRGEADVGTSILCVVSFCCAVFCCGLLRLSNSTDVFSILLFLLTRTYRPIPTILFQVYYYRF